MRILWLGFALFFGCRLTAQSAPPDYPAFEKSYQAITTRKGDDTKRLHELFALRWRYQMADLPEFATYVGYPGHNDRWTDYSAEAVARRKNEPTAPLRALESIDRSKLDSRDQLNYDLFRRTLDDAVLRARFPNDFLVLNQMEGLPQDVARNLEMAPRNNLADYQALLARLRSVPKFVDETIQLLERGLKAGVTPPKITLRDVPGQVRSQLEPDPDKNALLVPFRSFPPSMAEADRQRLSSEAKEILARDARPAFERLLKFLEQTYLPGAREKIALSEMPDGKAWYAANVRLQTTTSLSVEEIHQLGLTEVKRIRNEMDQVIKRAEFKGTFDEFLTFLRTDPQFYYKDARDLIEAYRDICKQVDPALMKLFGKLPRTTYGVLPIPNYAEKSQTTAYYQPGSPDSGRPGYFYANTYALDTRPKWEMEPLTLHEAVPGHHLQLALAQELEGVPAFRRHLEYTVFVEGWALYAESLGEELGLYQDPYAKFGQLTYEMWRAIRLVVDTGMHQLGWSRERAIDYFLTNASKNKHDITVEVDRYIVWPGQALAYKIGELRIKELRALAAKTLGDRFDLRAFHDELLGQGSIPIDLLETRMKAWIEQRKSLARSN